MLNVNDGKNKDNEIVALKDLQPWGEAVSLFARERPNSVLAWLETGASKESQIGGKNLSTIGMGARRSTSTNMRLLLVHQNFPGQFRDLGPALCDRGHELKAIGSSQRKTDPRIEVLRYEHQLGERSGMHPHSLEG